MLGEEIKFDHVITHLELSDPIICFALTNNYLEITITAPITSQSMKLQVP